MLTRNSSRFFQPAMCVIAKKWFTTAADELSRQRANLHAERLKSLVDYIYIGAGFTMGTLMVMDFHDVIKALAMTGSEDDKNEVLPKRQTPKNKI